MQLVVLKIRRLDQGFLWRGCLNSFAKLNKLILKLIELEEVLRVCFKLLEKLEEGKKLC